MITRKILENIELEVGCGSNDFKMSRGSFVYNQKYNKTKLCLASKEQYEKYTKLNYENIANGEIHSLIITEEDDSLEVTYESASANKNNRFWISFGANASEHIYGCGETFSKFDLKGENVRIWVAEHQNTDRIGKKLIRETIFGKKPKKVLPFKKFESYYAQPTFTSSDKYFLHVFTDTYAEFSFQDKSKTVLYLQEKPHFIVKKADSFKELSSKLSDLLGHQRELPEWTYDGAILAVQEGCEVIDKKIKAAEEKGVKIAGIWSQDWCGCRRTGFGYQVMWNWQYDEEQYANLPEKIIEWNNKGIKFLGYINPFIALEKNIYEEAKEKGYCVKDKEGNDYQVTITTFPAAMVDFTNPEAYEWYKGLIINNMIGIGLSGWMADFGEYLPVDCVLYSGEDPYLMHNKWPAMWAKLNYEAIKEAGKEGEIFFFTRAGHTETIKYSHLMWNGDQHVDWSLDDGIAAVIPATLSLAMSGYGMTHSDVGGYTTMKKMLSRSKELLMRWEEMNVFSPLYRFHEGNQPTMDVQFDADEELLLHLEKCTNTHIRLREYIKDLVAENVKNGTPVMRPLFYHYDEDRAYTESLEYLLGEDILVAPVIDSGAIDKKVYLPNDEWVHLYTKQEYVGGDIIVEAPIGKPPVFIRKKSHRFDELIGIV